LETTATFDEQADEFVIHTPTISATKVSYPSPTSTILGWLNLSTLQNHSGGLVGLLKRRLIAQHSLV
jgi:hypothetical protein